MELGFHTIHFSPMFGGSAPLLDVLQATADSGFDAVGFDLASIDAHVAAGGTVEEIVTLLADAHLRCSDVLVLAPGGGDPDVLATARRLAALASELGTDTCIASVAGPVPWNTLVATLGECATVLSDDGVRLAIEFTPYSPLSSLRAARELCEAVGWERTGLVLDSLHFFRGETPWSELTDLDATQIALVQYSDAPATAPEMLVDESRNARLVPGEGDLPLADLVTALYAIGFDGLVSAEILSEPFRRTDPAIGARRAHDALAEAWVTDAAG